MRRGRRWARWVGLGAAGAVAVSIPAIADTLSTSSSVDAGLAWRDVLQQRAPVLPSPGDTEEAIIIFADPPAAEAPPGQRAAAADAIARRQAELQPVLEQLGAVVERRYRILLNGMTIRVATGRLPSIAALAEVQAVVPVTYLAPAAVKARPAGRARGGQGQRTSIVRPLAPAPAHVALIDTGIDVSHPWLGGSIGPTSPVIGGLDVVDLDGDPTGTSAAEAHGTAMAGLVLRSPALQGLAPARVPRLLAYRVVADETVGSQTMALARSDRVLTAMERAVDPNGDGDPSDRADVVLLGVSRAFGGGGLDPLERAARAADRLGSIVVAPAGNEGATQGGVGSVGGPAAAPTVLTVGALGSTETPRSARLDVKVGPAEASLEPLPLMGPAPSGIVAPIVVVGGVDGLAGGATREEYLDAAGASLVQGAIAVVGRGGAPLAQKARAAAAAGAVALGVWDQDGDGAFPGIQGGADWPIPVIGLGAQQGSALVATRGSLPDMQASIVALGTVPRDPTVTSFSSRGPTARSRVKPDLVAPGVDQPTAAPGRASDGSPLATLFTGTSASAAEVAAYALRLRVDHPDLAAADARSLMVQAATTVSEATPADAGAGAANPAVMRPLAVDPPLVSFARDTQAPTRVTVALHDLTGADAHYRLALDTGDGTPLPIGGDVVVGANVRRGVQFRIPAGTQTLTGRLLVTPAAGGEPVAWAPFVALPPAPVPAGALGVPQVSVKDGTAEATVQVGLRERRDAALVSATLHGVALWLVPQDKGEPLAVTGDKSRGDWPTGTYRFIVSRRLASGLDVPAGTYRLRVTATAPDGGHLQQDSAAFDLG